MTSNSNDPEIESAAKEIARDPSEKTSSDDQATVEKEGVMTPDQDAVEDANASGINPDK
jgi:hypothetical protein